MRQRKRIYNVLLEGVACVFGGYIVENCGAGTETSKPVSNPVVTCYSL